MAIDLYAYVEECEDPESALREFKPLSQSGLLCVSEDGTSFRPSIYNQRVLDATGFDICNWDDIFIEPEDALKLSVKLAAVSAADHELGAVRKYFNICARHSIRVQVT